MIPFLYVSICAAARTAAAIRAIDPEAKILLSSGFVQEGAVQDLLDNGAAGFIAKPHRLPKLTRAIRDVLDGKPVTGQL